MHPSDGEQDPLAIPLPLPQQGTYFFSTAALTEAGIPFTPATSAMFVWLDLR